MYFNLAAPDLLNLLFVPLMVLTVVEAKKNWKSLWDSHLTPGDRHLLQRIVIFLALPVVVFFHELGHVAAIKLFGGGIKVFHYAFLWGYVVPDGTFTPTQTIWTFLSGSLVQIIIGFLALTGAAFATSPPVVAFLVYLYFWSVGGTVVLYALMSLTGLYGDWIAIYTTPTPHPEMVIGIGAVHIMLVIFLAWNLKGQIPRKWFASRTCPEWLEEQSRLWSEVHTSPSAPGWLDLAWSYYDQNLFTAAEDCLGKARQMEPSLPDVTMFEGALAYKRGRIKEAKVAFQKLLARSFVTARLRARALIALAGCQLKENDADAAISSYTKAVEVDPGLADPRFYLAVLLGQAGYVDRAATELMELSGGSGGGLEWLDRSLKDLVIPELNKLLARKASKP